MADGGGKRAVSLLISLARGVIGTVFVIPRGTCRFHPSCSQYAQEAVQRLPLPQAFFKIIVRVLRCNPLSKGGFDPV